MPVVRMPPSLAISRPLPLVDMPAEIRLQILNNLFDFPCTFKIAIVWHKDGIPGRIFFEYLIWSHRRLVLNVLLTHKSFRAEVEDVIQALPIMMDYGCGRPKYLRHPIPEYLAQNVQTINFGGYAGREARGRYPDLALHNFPGLKTLQYSLLNGNRVHGVTPSELDNPTANDLKWKVIVMRKWRNMVPFGFPIFTSRVERHYDILIRCNLDHYTSIVRASASPSTDPMYADDEEWRCPGRWMTYDYDTRESWSLR